MKKVIGILSLATLLFAVASCNNSSDENEKVKKETTATDKPETKKETVVEVPLPPLPPPPPSPEEVLKKLKAEMVPERIPFFLPPCYKDPGFRFVLNLYIK